MNVFKLLILSKLTVRVFAQRRRCGGWPQARKQIGGVSCFGCPGVFVVDLSALEDKFVADSVSETAEKIRQQ